MFYEVFGLFVMEIGKSFVVVAIVDTWLEYNL